MKCVVLTLIAVLICMSVLFDVTYDVSRSVVRRRHALTQKYSAMKAMTIACLVPTSDKGGVDLIQRTWGASCNALWLFLDTEEVRNFSKTPFSQVVMLQTTQSCSQQNVTCDKLWEKVLRMWSWVGKNAHGYDWYIKADVDTYVFVQNARYHLRVQQQLNRHYVGHVVENNFGTPPYVSGGFYALSPRAVLNLQKPIDTVLTSGNTSGGLEDCRLAALLSIQGFEPHTILDQQGREVVMLLPLEDHLQLTPYLSRRLRKHTWYFHKASQTQFALKCCSKIPVAFHWIKNRSNMLKIHEYMTGDKEGPPDYGAGSVNSYLNDVKSNLLSENSLRHE